MVYDDQDGHVIYSAANESGQPTEAGILKKSPVLHKIQENNQFTHPGHRAHVLYET